jgi:hypothetical protein
LTKRYHDRNIKELFELKLGSMTMDDYERKVLDLLKYVEFVKDEHVKIQRFMSGITSIFCDKIQYDDSKTLYESIRIAKVIHDKHRGRSNFQHA